MPGAAISALRRLLLAVQTVATAAEAFALDALAPLVVAAIATHLRLRLAGTAGRGLRPCFWYIRFFTTGALEATLA